MYKLTKEEIQEARDVLSGKLTVSQESYIRLVSNWLTLALDQIGSYETLLGSAVRTVELTMMIGERRIEQMRDVVGSWNDDYVETREFVEQFKSQGLVTCYMCGNKCIPHQTLEDENQGILHFCVSCSSIRFEPLSGESEEKKGLTCFGCGVICTSYTRFPSAKGSFVFFCDNCMPTSKTPPEK